MKNVRFVFDDINDPAVCAALDAVPRDRFIPTRMKNRAGENRPLPIGCGQTISQPYIVAYMSQILQLQPHHRVLEIGTGSGYQAAILAKLVHAVYSVEIIPQLAEAARALLAELGYTKVRVRQGNGWAGWPEEAPFDRIIVTAAAPSIPQSLLDQLAPGGRMVIPVGLPEAVQSLMLAERTGEGDVTTERLLSVRFVPMTGEHNSGEAPGEG